MNYIDTYILAVNSIYPKYIYILYMLSVGIILFKQRFQFSLNGYIQTGYSYSFRGMCIYAIIESDVFTTLMFLTETLQSATMQTSDVYHYTRETIEHIY